MHHLEQDIAQLNGRNVAASQLLWLLTEGDLVLRDEPCRREQDFDLRVSKLRQGTFKVPIYRNLSDEDERPTRFMNARQGK